MNNKSDRHFGLFVYLGIEFRNYVHSGLSQELLKFSDVSILSSKQNKILNQEIAEKKLSSIYLPASSFTSRTRQKQEKRFLSIRRASLRKRGDYIFRMMGEDISIRLKDRIIGTKLFYSIFKHLSWRENHTYYFDPEIANIIKSNAITDIVLQSYFTIDNLVMAITAKKMGCRVWVVNWGWKDFYFHEYIPFKPDGFFTWSSALKANYEKFNKHIPTEKIINAGNLSFDKLFNYQPVRDLSYYAEKYGFDRKSKLILYTMVNPVFCSNEQDIVELIYKELKKIDEPIVLLLKPNPMDSKKDRFKGVLRKGEVIVLENLWVFDKENDFNMLTSEGQNEWLDLIYYSKLNISVASTVTAECLIMKTPVINVLFDHNNERHKEFTRFYNAPFYKRCHNRKDVFACKKSVEVKNAIEQILENSTIDDITPIINPKGKSIQRFVEEVSNVGNQ
jgi:hypothetical protein